MGGGFRGGFFTEKKGGGITDLTGYSAPGAYWLKNLDIDIFVDFL